MEIQEVTLGEISTITMGTSPKGETYNYAGVGMPLLNGPTEFGLIHPKCTLFTTDSKKDSKKGDLIFCVRGSTTGRMNWADMPYSLGRGVCSIRGATPMDTKYIKYYLENKLDALLKLSGGATFPNLTGNDFATFHIHYQKNRHKIAAILSTYDNLIENNTRRIKILEEMAQALYREWFVKFRFPGHEKVKMMESELGMVPEGWNSANLTEVTSYINRGITPKYDDQSDSLVINQRCIRNNKIDLKIARKHKKKVPKEKYVCFGDVLINSTGVGTLGRVAQLYENIEDCSVDTHVSIVRPSNEVDLDYFGLALQDLESYFESKGAGATGQTELRREIIGETPLIIPPENLQKQFGTLISPNRRKIIIILQQNEILSRTRDLLLPKLISGEVDVENIDVQMPNNGGA